MTIVVGLDVGYGNTKIVFGSDGGVSQVVFPSVVAKCVHSSGIAVPGTAGGRKEIVELGSMSYYVGKTAMKHCRNTLTSRHEDWITTSAYQVLIKRAIELSGISNPSAEALVVTGLPVAYFDESMAAVRKTVEIVFREYFAAVEVRGIPQPMGAFIDMLLQYDGTVRDENMIRDHVGIVDIGFQTTDFIAVNRGLFIHEEADSMELGVSSIMENIAKDVYRTTRHRPTTFEVVEALKEKSIMAFGRPISIAPFLEEHSMSFLQMVESRVKSIWGTAGDKSSIILAGGGAALLRPLLTFYPQIRIAADPQFSVAAGYYKAGVRAVTDERA